MFFRKHTLVKFACIAAYVCGMAMIVYGVPSYVRANADRKLYVPTICRIATLNVQEPHDTCTMVLQAISAFERPQIKVSAYGGACQLAIDQHILCYVRNTPSYNLALHRPSVVRPIIVVIIGVALFALTAIASMTIVLLPDDDEKSEKLEKYSELEEHGDDDARV